MFSLKDILKTTRESVEIRKRGLPLDELKKRLKDVSSIRSLQKALVNSKEIALIGEIKKASPSAGLIRERFSPVELAQTYEESGAKAISVLTEENFFQGKIDYLSKIKEKVKLPLLRKDFIIDEYQIWESRFFGADAILLIVSILNDEELLNFFQLSQKIGMDVILEIHSEEEWKRVSKIPAKLVGINNRNLRTLEIDLKTSFDLITEIPKERIVISESGIKRREDVLNLENAGIKGILVGETIMKTENTAEKIRYLLGK